MDTIAAFDRMTKEGHPLGNDRNVLYGPVFQPDGKRALLWQIYLREQDLRSALGFTGSLNGLPVLDLQEVESYLREQCSARAVCQELLLLPLEQKVEPDLNMPGLKKWYLLTPAAQTLRDRYPSGAKDEAWVLQLGIALCELLQQYTAKGFSAGSVDPDRVMLNEAGSPILCPWWPGSEEAKPQGFWIQAEPQKREAYSVGMLLYWLLNDGMIPFETPTAPIADAEQRRLAGEPIPAPVSASPELSRLLAEVCCCTAQYAWTLQKLVSSLKELAGTGSSAAEEEEPEELQPEEEEPEEFQDPPSDTPERAEEEAKTLHEADKKDKRLLAGIIVGIAVVFAVIILVVVMQFGFRLNNQMDSGNYATALSQIEKEYNNGKNVDRYVDEYIDQSLSEGEYIHAIQACDYYSAELVPDADRIDRIVSATVSAGEPSRAGRFLRSFAKINDSCAALAAQIQKEEKLS